MALISVLRQQALELENGPGTGARRPSSPEPAASWSLSLRVLESVYGARSGSGNRGAPQRDSQVREVRTQVGGLSLILPRNRPRSCRGILTNGKRATASQSSTKGREETEENRVEAEEPFRSRAGVWPAVFVLRAVFQSGLFLLALFFNIYIHINECVSLKRYLGP